jgi:hypothetical protein
MIRSAVVIALLGFASSCQRKAEQPPPLPSAPAESPPPPRTPPPVSKPDAAATAPGAAAPHPDASASDSGGQAAAALRPTTTGDPVLLEHVGPESTSLEIQLPPRFTLNITELTEDKLPRATLKGPRFSIDIFSPDAGFTPLAMQKQQLKQFFPAVVFDRAEEIPDGNIMIYHAPDEATKKIKYYSGVDRPKMDVICGSSPVKSLELAEQAISICLSLHDRNAM